MATGVRTGLHLFRFPLHLSSKTFTFNLGCNDRVIALDDLDTSLLKLIDEGERNVAIRAAASSQVSRQTAAARLRKLSDAGLIEATGTGPGRQYALRDVRSEMREFSLEGLREDVVWRGLASLVSELPENVRALWHYGMTEMVNNAIDQFEQRGI